MKFADGQKLLGSSEQSSVAPRSWSADDRLVAFVRRYLRTWGLSDRALADEAARRLISKADFGDVTDGRAELQRRVVSLTRRWVEAFAREETDSENDWFWRAQTLLTRYPQTFLETPIPETTHKSTPLNLLPETVPRLMIQQQITDSFEHVKDVLRDVAERFRGEQIGPESRRLIEPMP